VSGRRRLLGPGWYADSTSTVTVKVISAATVANSAPYWCTRTTLTATGHGRLPGDPGIRRHHQFGVICHKEMRLRMQLDELRKVLIRCGIEPKHRKKALAGLPDEIDIDRDGPILARFGITRDRLVDRLGGSP